jgi:integrase
MGSVNWRKRSSGRYQVAWRYDDGAQGAVTVQTEKQAIELHAEKLLEMARGTWIGRQRGKLSFARWVDEWWEVWSTEPGRSPTTLAATDNRRRRHVLPQLGSRPVEAITPKVLRQWQNRLGEQVGHESVMACRSIVFRVLRFAEDEGAIPVNPMRKVPAPRRPVDPEDVFNPARRRAYTPEEAGQLLACFAPFWWDHVITLLGTGLRFGELAGLHTRRVHLDRRIPVLQVVDTRYQAGRFGSGIKNRPKSAAGIRELPLARQVVEAIRRQLPPGAGPDTLVFVGPGGGNYVTAGTRTMLSRDNFRRTYRRAVARLTGPAIARLRPTATRVLRALGEGGPATVEELTASVGRAGRALNPATVKGGLEELRAVGLATTDADTPTARWAAALPTRPGVLDDLEPHGAHDFRHTFSTWLEDAGIPTRVIDELMGHQRSRRAELEGGSRIGARYRHTTPEMAARVVAAVEARLTVVLEVAEAHSRE